LLAHRQEQPANKMTTKGAHLIAIIPPHVLRHLHYAIKRTAHHSIGDQLPSVIDGSALSRPKTLDQIDEISLAPQADLSPS
jgi:hypothetical protein